MVIVKTIICSKDGVTFISHQIAKIWWIAIFTTVFNGQLRHVYESKVSNLDKCFMVIQSKKFILFDLFIVTKID